MHQQLSKVYRDDHWVNFLPPRRPLKKEDETRVAGTFECTETASYPVAHASAQSCSTRSTARCRSAHQFIQRRAMHILETGGHILHHRLVREWCSKFVVGSGDVMTLALAVTLRVA